MQGQDKSQLTSLTSLTTNQKVGSSDLSGRATSKDNFSYAATVPFLPTVAGPNPNNAPLDINVAAPATSAAVALIRNVVLPTYTLSPTSLDLRSQVHITSPPQTVTVTNTGKLPLTISALSTRPSIRKMIDCR